MRSSLGWGRVEQAYGSWNLQVPCRECEAGLEKPLRSYQLGSVQPKDLRRPPREPDQLVKRRANGRGGAEWGELGEPEEQVLNPVQAALKEVILVSRFSQAWPSSSLTVGFSGATQQPLPKDRLGE